MPPFLFPQSPHALLVQFVGFLSASLDEVAEVEAGRLLDVVERFERATCQHEVTRMLWTRLGDQWRETLAQQDSLGEAVEEGTG